MEKKELVTVEKKSLGERIGQSIGGAIKVGVIGTAVGGAVGLFTGGDGTEIVEEGAEALKDNVSTAIGNGAQTGALVGAAGGAATGWADKIKMERAELQQAKINGTGEEVTR